MAQNQSIQKLGLKTSQKEEEEETKKALEAMEHLVEIKAFQEINDPVAWQKEQRKDREIGQDE